MNGNQLDEVDPCVIGALFWLSNLIIRIENCCYHAYSCNDIIKESVDNISYYTTWTCNHLQRKRTEPKESKWGSCCKIINNRKLIEEFIYKDTIGIEVNPGDFLIYHLPNYILCSCSSIIERTTPPVLSEIRFLSIEYTHPDMIEPIQLVLEKEWCIVGNEVLGRIHILRLLEYQFCENDYIFDERYVVNIIDSNINMIHIYSTQYIRLDNEDYEVIDWIK